ncbi:MAG: quinone oxidoreductase [Parvularculaceae bacterium]
MSKAVFLDAHGGPEHFALRERDLPAPGVGEIRVRHTAIGLNFIDIYQRKGLYPVALPAVLGSEAAGVVTAVGEGVTAFKTGDRVVHMGNGGAYAEEANAPAAMTAKVPGGVSDEAAAATFLKGLTADMLLRQVYPLKAGEACLVYAASGGVGVILTQWAAKIGARVIAVVGNDEKAKLARNNGAAEVIVRAKIKDIATEVRRLTEGRGVAVVYDSVGAATFTDSLDSLALRGHMVTYGNASGPVPPVAPLELARRGSLTLTRPSLFHYATPDRLPAMAADLFAMLASGAVKAHVAHRFALKDVADAHRLLESGESQGAIVLAP